MEHNANTGKEYTVKLRNAESTFHKPKPDYTSQPERKMVKLGLAWG